MVFNLFVGCTLRQNASDVSCDATPSGATSPGLDPNPDQPLVGLRVSSGMEAPLRCTLRTRRCRRVGTTWPYVLYVLYVLLGVGLVSLASAQGDCSGISSSGIFRVEDATGVTELRAAVNCTNGGAVEAEWVGRVPIGAPIAVSSGTFLSVTGEDTSAEAYASTTTRLFEVGAGSRLTLTQLKLSGGSSADGGGAIYSRSANLTLNTCVFEGNAATDGNGGAVWVRGGTITIVGGEYSNNTASRYGGAVLANTATLVVEGGATFESNAAIVGSALFCEGSDSIDVTSDILCSLSDAVFVSNTAIEGTATGDEDFEDLGGGGAAAFLLANVTVTDSIFRGNYARIEGGALYGGESTFIAVDGCTFENNTSPLYGGAISASSMILGGNTQITYNSVSKSGGAVSDSAARYFSFRLVFFTRLTAVAVLIYYESRRHQSNVSEVCLCQPRRECWYRDGAFDRRAERRKFVYFFGRAGKPAGVVLWTLYCGDVDQVC